MPLSWLYEEQVRQIRLGAFELVKMTPVQVVHEISKRLDALVSCLDVDEIALWRGMYRCRVPRSDQRLGMLRIQPKVRI